MKYLSLLFMTLCLTSFARDYWANNPKLQQYLEGGLGVAMIFGPEVSTISLVDSDAQLNLRGGLDLFLVKFDSPDDKKLPDGWGSQFKTTKATIFHLGLEGTVYRFGSDDQGGQRQGIPTYYTIGIGRRKAEIFKVSQVQPGWGAWTTDLYSINDSELGMNLVYVDEPSAAGLSFFYIKDNLRFDLGPIVYSDGQCLGAAKISYVFRP